MKDVEQAPDFAPVRQDRMQALISTGVEGAFGDRGARPVTNVGQFVISRISNGYLIESRSNLNAVPRLHYAEDYKQVGEFITATCVEWELRGAGKDA